MATEKKVRCVCKDCGTHFLGVRHRTVCDECKKIHNREAAKKYRDKKKVQGNNTKRYSCKFCGGATSRLIQICTTCEEKYRLCGIIVEMLRRAKEGK